MLKKMLRVLVVACALMGLSAPTALAWVECGPVVCVGSCGEDMCSCVFFDDATGQYRGFILYRC